MFGKSAELHHDVLFELFNYTPKQHSPKSKKQYSRKDFISQIFQKIQYNYPAIKNYVEYFMPEEGDLSKNEFLKMSWKVHHLCKFIFKWIDLMIESHQIMIC